MKSASETWVCNIHNRQGLARRKCLQLEVPQAQGGSFGVTKTEELAFLRLKDHASLPMFGYQSVRIDLKLRWAARQEHRP